MTRRACSDCLELEHHQPACRQMFFANGRRRGVPADAGFPTLTLEAELGRIFAGTTEAMIERHVAERRT